MSEKKTSTLTMGREFYVCPSCGASSVNSGDVFERISIVTPVLDFIHKELDTYVNVSEGEALVRCRFCHKTLRLHDYMTRYRAEASIIYRCAECGGYVEIPDPNLQYSRYRDSGWVEYTLVFCSEEHRYAYLQKWHDKCTVCGKHIEFTDDAYSHVAPVCSMACYDEIYKLSRRVQRGGTRAKRDNVEKLKNIYADQNKPMPYTLYRYKSVRDIFVSYMDNPMDILKYNAVSVEARF
jgi:predicted RNA-binding Zn-ribbon protein involved in translation (DUF1610 family)